MQNNANHFNWFLLKNFSTKLLQVRDIYIEIIIIHFDEE